MQHTTAKDWVLRTALAVSLAATLAATKAYATDKLLEETVDFTGTLLFLEIKSPAISPQATRPARCRATVSTARRCRS